MKYEADQTEFGFTKAVERPMVYGGTVTPRGKLQPFDGRDMNRYEAWLAVHHIYNGGVTL